MSTLSVNVNNSLNQYGYLVYIANQKLNLVSRRSNLHDIMRQVEEAVLPMSWEVCKIKSPVLDIGTGAGIPGIPLKLADTSLNMNLLESNRRKCAFITNTVSNLKLSNVSVICSRAEVFADNSENTYRFMTVVSRGVGRLDQMLDWAERLLAERGELILWKDDSIRDELAEINRDIWESPQFLKCQSQLTLARVVRKSPTVMASNRV